MTQEMSRDLRPSRRAIAIAAIPAVDCIFNQANTALNLTIVGLSPLQLLRGGLLLLLSITCAFIIAKDPRKLFSLPISVIAGLMLIAGIVTKELGSTGGIVVAGVIPYGQMLYWLMLWSAAVLLCSTTADAWVILKGLAIGSVMTAASVFLGLAVGTGNFYAGDAVRSSAGWFETAKMITGVLVTGGVILLFLGQRTQGWMHPLLACFTFTACIATYARAGAVALFISLSWLLLWLCVWGHRSHRSGRHFACLSLLICGIVAASVSPGQLFSRWNDVKDSEAAGSGRATFWQIAIDDFAKNSPVNQLVGRGYSSMSEMLYEKYGDDIKHTHNDGLDMLLVGGTVGCVWLLIFIFDFARRAFMCPISSASRSASIAILLTYLCHGQLTGQIWGTDAMTYYTLSLSSIFVLRQNTFQENINVLNQPSGLRQT